MQYSGWPATGNCTSTISAPASVSAWAAFCAAVATSLSSPEGKCSFAKPILYPNPSDGIVSLDLRSNYNDVTIQLNDILGRQVMNRNYSEGKVFNLNITEEPGVYFLSVYAEDRKVVFKLIIN